MFKRLFIYVLLVFIIYLFFRGLVANDASYQIYIGDCDNIGKYIHLCGKEYKIINYYIDEDVYLLDNNEKIKASLVKDCIFVK